MKLAVEKRQRQEKYYVKFKHMDREEVKKDEKQQGNVFKALTKNRTKKSTQAQINW